MKHYKTLQCVVTPGNSLADKFSKSKTELMGEFHSVKMKLFINLKEFTIENLCDECSRMQSKNFVSAISSKIVDLDPSVTQ